MNNVIPINLAVEDVLSEAVLMSVLQQSDRPYEVGNCYMRGGFGYLKKNIKGFNNAAKGTPFLVLTDLDRMECAPLLIQEWLPIPKHNKLIFRIAVREVESWLLADRSAFAKFLGIKGNLIPFNPDELDDPKRSLIKLAAKSRKRSLRESIVPAAGSTAKIGPDYNGTLSGFVRKNWNVKEAAKHSPSLKKALNAVKLFQPV